MKIDHTSGMSLYSDTFTNTFCSWKNCPYYIRDDLKSVGPTSGICCSTFCGKKMAKLFAFTCSFDNISWPTFPLETNMWKWSDYVGCGECLASSHRLTFALMHAAPLASWLACCRWTNNGSEPTTATAGARGGDDGENYLANARKNMRARPDIAILRVALWFGFWASFSNFLTQFKSIIFLHMTSSVLILAILLVSVCFLLLQFTLSDLSRYYIQYSLKTLLVSVIQKLQVQL